VTVVIPNFQKNVKICLPHLNGTKFGCHSYKDSIMKTVKIIGLAISLFSGVSAFSQTKLDSLGLPGDNFDLYGALEVFKKAKNPEEFEKAINLKDNEINNLDLDGDGKTDYVKVIDKAEKNGHNLVMQVAVSENETQDVAVIEVEKTGDEKAHVQIVGDEELYGKDYILEPSDQVAATNTKTSAKEKQSTEDDVYATNDNSNRTPDNTDNKSNNSNNSNSNVVVNVWGWPSVQYIYGPSYVVWVSPWYWNYYPGWWSPWAPVYWRYHWRRAYFYHPYYRRAYFYRSPAMHSFYYGHRTTSGTVHRNRESGFYREKQQVYKQNTPRGERYNNKPARDHREQNGTVRPKRENAPAKNNNPRNNQPANQTPRGTDKQPKMEKRQNTRPSQNQQPRQNVQPRQQQPRMQNSPAPQRQQGSGSHGGGNRGGSFHGGGGRHR
jgi:uncharacterized membrane protein YgcG